MWFHQDACAVDIGGHELGGCIITCITFTECMRRGGQVWAQLYERCRGMFIAETFGQIARDGSIMLLVFNVTIHHKMPREYLYVDM